MIKLNYPMKCFLFAIPLLIASLCFFNSAKSVSAAVVPCNPGNPTVCTVCSTNDGVHCVAVQTDSCTSKGYVPDTAFCNSMDINSCLATLQYTNCLAAPISPTISPSTSPTITPSTSPTISPSVPPLTSCWSCGDSATCYPAPSGSCPYTDYASCDSACSGNTPTKFNCVNNDCIEDQNGKYVGFAACNANCGTRAAMSNPYCNGNKDDGIKTAIGCLKVVSGTDLVTTILRIATGIGGGLALALILYGTFIVTTSAGMPDKLKAGSEIITSAIIGLIFILLSVFLVNLIGINILGIPGLS